MAKRPTAVDEVTQLKLSFADRLEYLIRKQVDEEWKGVTEKFLAKLSPRQAKKLQKRRAPQTVLARVARAPKPKVARVPCPSKAIEIPAPQAEEVVQDGLASAAPLATVVVEPTPPVLPIVPVDPPADVTAVESTISEDEGPVPVHDDAPVFRIHRKRHEAELDDSTPVVAPDVYDLDDAPLPPLMRARVGLWIDVPVEKEEGLYGRDRDYTLEEVGKVFGLTRERIRQIEVAALKKLRTRMPLAGITEDDVIPDRQPWQHNAKEKLRRG